MSHPIEDIVPPNERRSIRDIPIPAGRRKMEMPETPNAFLLSRTRPIRSRTKSKKILWGAAIFALIILVFAILSLFSSATLAYIPKSQTATFSSDAYTAYKTATTGQLPYSIVDLSEDKNTTAPASGQVQVSTKASGTIIIYNNTGTASQKLIATTRFETTDGHIYRIPKAVTVPGRTTSNGTTVPGSVETTVIADQPGADYNIGLSDFTVPGFQGDPRYATIYARSATPMTGGFVGTQPQVSSSDLSKAQATIETQIKSDLLSQANAQVPANFILLPTLSQIEYTNLSQSTSTSPSVATVSEHGDFTGLMFKKSDLAQFLAVEKLGALVVTTPVDISDFSSLTFALTGTDQNLSSTSSVDFQVSGTAQVEWITDETALAQSVAGANKNSLDSILTNYPSIQSATATIRPFWKSSFPSDPTKITIKKNNG